MAELVRIEPALFREDEAWFVYDNGRQILRKLHMDDAGQRAPMIISDHIDAVQSMANGKYYESKSGLYASYRPDGNPQGIRYECVGNEDTTKFEKPKRDQYRAIQALERARQEMGWDI